MPEAPLRWSAARQWVGEQPIGQECRVNTGVGYLRLDFLVEGHVAHCDAVGDFVVLRHPSHQKENCTSGREVASGVDGLGGNVILGVVQPEYLSIRIADPGDGSNPEISPIFGGRSNRSTGCILIESARLPIFTCRNPAPSGLLQWPVPLQRAP
jgi:hypothetical protein